MTEQEQAPSSGEMINVLNPGGDLVSIPKAALPVATEQGYQQATPQDIQSFTDKENYGGVTGSLAAAGLGALRGATLSLSDLALTKSGMVNPETLAGYQRENPVSSGVGEVGGAIASAALAPEVAPVAMIGKAGRAVEGGLEALNAAKAATTATAAARILGGAGSIAATAAGSAVEGALFAGIGSTINEYALGDPDLNGQKILANVGHGALVGGALGGLLKSAAIGIPPSIKAAKEGLVAVRDALIGTGEDSAGLLGKALPEGRLLDALKNRAVNLDKDELKDLVDNVTAKLNDVHKNTESAVRELNSELRPEETKALIETANPKAVNVARQDVINELNSATDLMKSEPAIYNPGIARETEQLRDTLVGRMGKDTSPLKTFQTLKEIKQSLQEIAYPGGVPSRADLKAIEALNGVISKVDSTLKNPDVFGFVGSSQAAHDEMLSSYYKFVSPKSNRPTAFQKMFMTKDGVGRTAKWAIDPQKVELAIKRTGTVKGDKAQALLNDYFEVLKKLPEHLENTYSNVPNARFDPEQLQNYLSNSQKTIIDSGEKYVQAIANSKRGLGMGDLAAATIATSHPVVGAAIEAYNIATRPIESMNKLAEIERLIGKTTAAIGKGAKSIFDPAMKAAESSRAVWSRVGTDEHLERYGALKTQLAQLNSDPRYLIDKLSSGTEELHSAAPDIASGTQMASTRAVQFLSSKIPGPPQSNPFEAPYQPSITELSKFERFHSVTENPMLALSQIKNGTLGQETIETLSSVYPKLFEEMRQAVLEQATDKLAAKEPIAYQTKQMISMFLGYPLDPSLKPQSVQANQMAYMQKANPQPQVQPSKGGLEKISVSQRSTLHPPDEA